jgi:hypothetical protein
MKFIKKKSTSYLSSTLVDNFRKTSFDINKYIKKMQQICVLVQNNTYGTE